MTARDLMRLAASHGGNLSALNVVIRTLRESFERGHNAANPQFGLPVAGRGVHAHHLTPTEAAWVLISYAGSDVAAHGVQRLPTLAMLQAPEDFTIPTLGTARWSLQQVIDEAFQIPEWLDDIIEVRIARNFDFARLVRRSGPVVKFFDAFASVTEVEEIEGSFLSEGIMGQALLRRIADAMAAA